MWVDSCIVLINTQSCTPETEECGEFGAQAVQREESTLLDLLTKVLLALAQLIQNITGVHHCQVSGGARLHQA